MFIDKTEGYETKQEYLFLPLIFMSAEKAPNITQPIYIPMHPFKKEQEGVVTLMLKTLTSRLFYQLIVSKQLDPTNMFPPILIFYASGCNWRIIGQPCFST